MLFALAESFAELGEVRQGLAVCRPRSLDVSGQPDDAHLVQRVGLVHAIVQLQVDVERFW
jgi:hypothetical protein